MSRYTGGSRRHSGLQAVHEINVMPLVDLLLQLFIAVIIFFPVVEYGMGINLPKATTETIKEPQTRTLAVDKAGNFYLNDVRKTLPQLQADLFALSNHNPPITVLVKADQADNYGKVMEALKALHAAKITRIALMTQEENVPKTAMR
jgi:biopolymer transport protein ExbD